MAITVIAPSPIPVPIRASNSVVALKQAALSRENTENQSTEARSETRRPSRSAIRPPNAAPRNMPTKPAR